MSIQPLNIARVGSLYQTGLAQTNVTDVQKELLLLEQQISTGKLLVNPSDNPSDAAVAMQLQKTLAQRQTYLGNLSEGQNQLGEVDNTLSDLNNLLQQAQTIASADVGSDVTDQERQGDSAVVQTLYKQALDLANKDFEGVYLFAGDKSTAPPFVDNGSGVQFVGSTNLLQNVADANSSLTFMVSGAQVFGALSTQVQGSVDLSPRLTAQTQIADVGGAVSGGVHLGSIVIGNGATSANVDLSQAVSVQDIVNRINAAGVGGVTAALTGQGITLSGGASDNITVQDVGSGTTAADLGLLHTVGSGGGVPVVGASVAPRITALTALSALKSGAAIDLASGIKITSGQKTVTVSFAGANNVQDLLNDINKAGVPVTAQINAAGNGIDIINPTQGAAMSAAENGGTTAADLGIRSFVPQTALSTLNNGKGIGHATSGADFQILRTDGTNFSVSLAGAQTVQDVINAINAADAGGGVTASFATTGNGIVLNDTSGGAGTLTVTPQNFSTAASDLGLTTPAAGSSITGSDVNPVSVNGIFSNLAKLRDALNSGDQAAITDAGTGLKADQDRVIKTRGVVGAQVKDMASRTTRIQDENVATQSLLSNLTDTDFTAAITKFQTLQQSLQASLQTAAKVMNQSLMDFLQ
jgi:flagellar hook-associated protein 3 FlgL